MARAPARSADARAVSQRPPGRGAGGLPARPRGARRATRPRARAGAARPPRSASSPTTRRSTRRSRRQPRQARSAVAGAAESDDRPRARARGVGERLAPDGAAADADRAGRGRQDAARARGRARASRPTSPTGRASCRSPPCNAARTCPRRSSARWASSCSRANPPSRRSSASSRRSSLLLVLDNCEHLPAAAPFIGGVLAACPGVDRARDQPRAARRCTPSSATRSRRCAARTGASRPRRADVDAVALFCERARAHDPGFELGDGSAAAVAEICRRVDGLPLAIELAAARCGLLSPAEIAERLEPPLGALGAGRARRARAPADAARDDRLEPRAAERRRAALLRALRRLRRRRDAGGGRGDHRRRSRHARPPRRQEPARAPPERGGRRGWRCWRRSARTPRERFAAPPDSEPSASATTATSSRSAQRHGTERALWGTSRKEHLAALDADIDNLRGASDGRSRQTTRDPRSRCVPRSGHTGSMRDRYADAVDWIDRALGLPGADAHPVAARARALLQVLGPVAARARGRATCRHG